MPGVAYLLLPAISVHNPVTIQIAPVSDARFRELKHVVGHELYQKGTDREWYVDFRDRAMADLTVANLTALQFTARVIS